ncbi:glycosyltransferase [Lachnoclostridium sp. An118]|uniref:glycosyltransferase n=1 Tax=Lachnoclostridium sp. An118 TaxID=1965547 RepID=UPI000B3A1246|nr:glycosyltransferase [Lachnoclostridium sp. An118]OUQ46185.1 hypothetical protein B5E62_16235 [Lachnoclostridium sp. An118]
MGKPLVSVILPNYNGEKFLYESIKSVLEQTYSNLELIIVDDASIDKSKEIIENFQDDRIRVVYLPVNGQICAALNTGIELANGKYIARIDSDDIWEKDKLTQQISALENDEKIGACFSYVSLVDENGLNISQQYEDIYNLFRTRFKTQKEWIRQLIFRGNCLSHPSAVIRKDVIEKVGKYNLTFVQGQDYELWIRIALKYKLQVIQAELVRYRWLPNTKKNISADTDYNNIRFYNEYIMAVFRFFQNISDEDFLLYFKDLFVNKNAESKLDLLCEKAFLCLNYDNTTRLYPIGLEILEQVFRQNGGPELLIKNYNFTIKDYYKINQQHIFYDSILEKEITKYEHEIEKLEKKITQKVAETEVRIRDEYENTKSWKLTLPLRNARNMYRTLKDTIGERKDFIS